MLQTSVFFLCIARLGASLAALLLYTFPFFVFLIQRFVFKQIATKIQWVSLLISLVGCLLIIAPLEQGQPIPTDSLGVIFGLLSGLIYAFYISFGAYFTKGIPPVSSASFLTSGASLGFALVAFFQGELSMPSVVSEWLLATLMALIATVIPLLCLVKGMQLLGATRTALLFTIEPVITIFFAILFFEESLTVPKMLGSACILGSALLIQRDRKKITATPL